MGDLGKIVVAAGFKKLAKCKKLPNLVTLGATYFEFSNECLISNSKDKMWKVKVSERKDESRTFLN